MCRCVPPTAYGAAEPKISEASRLVFAAFPAPEGPLASTATMSAASTTPAATPGAQRTEDFERFFGTPHGLGFEHAAKMFGIPYHHLQTVAALRDVYSAATDDSTPAIIEIRTDRHTNVEEHRRIVEQIRTHDPGDHVQAGLPEIQRS